jgi:hypothetical protein
VALTAFRQALLAARLGVAQSVVPTSGSPAIVNALWARLAEPESTFDALRDLLLGGGLGRCTPVYAGPTDTTVMTEDRNKVDPNGLATRRWLPFSAAWSRRQRPPDPVRGPGALSCLRCRDQQAERLAEAYADLEKFGDRMAHALVVHAPRVSVLLQSRTQGSAGRGQRAPSGQAGATRLLGTTGESPTRVTASYARPRYRSSGRRQRGTEYAALPFAWMRRSNGPVLLGGGRAIALTRLVVPRAPRRSPITVRSLPPIVVRTPAP